MTTEVLSIPDEPVSLDVQVNIAIDAFHAFLASEDAPLTTTTGWVGLWWHEYHQVWLIGCTYLAEDRGSALEWYDKQWKSPARLFYVRSNRAKLRCAKLARQRGVIPRYTESDI